MYEGQKLKVILDNGSIIKGELSMCYDSTYKIYLADIKKIKNPLIGGAGCTVTGTVLTLAGININNKITKG